MVTCTHAHTVYLNTVNRDNEKQWCVKILFEIEQVTFKVDTGPEVTATSDI